MCGIAGVVGPAQARQPAAAMTRALSHRGPDAMGLWHHGHVTLGATRLAILDPAAPAQPMAGSRPGLCLAFNGEIYNHAELRRELQRDGERFITGTDTEVVLKLYERHGMGLLSRLHGMYALAIVDGDRLFLARDRLGMKPLFYARVNDGEYQQIFAFASEIKALLQHPAVPSRLDTQALADSLLIGHPTGAATFFQDIRSLTPGHLLSVTLGDSLEVHTCRSALEALPPREASMSLNEAEELLDAQLGQAASSHLAADVEVGLMLSGGLDSSLLALYAAEHADQPLRTFSLGDHDQNADVAQAAQVARLIGARHRHIKPDFDDYLASIPAVVAAEEQPSSLYTVPLLLGCRQIATEVKACLNGEGADELFGGYSDYLDRAPRLAHIRAQLPVLQHLAVRPSDGALAIIEQLTSPQNHEGYLPAVFAVNLGDALERQHLNPLDRCAMASGLEMRVPYLDQGMLALLARIPLHHLVRSDILVRKYLLRRLALKRFGSAVIDVVLREKIGAPVSGIFLLDRFDQLCERTLPDDYAARHPFGACFASLRKLLMFDFFCELFFTHRGDVSKVGDLPSFMAERAGARQMEVPA